MHTFLGALVSRTCIQACNIICLCNTCKHLSLQAPPAHTSLSSPATRHGDGVSGAAFQNRGQGEGVSGALQLKTRGHGAGVSGAPLFRTADTATASVDAMMAENMAACSQRQPRSDSLKMYSSTGDRMAVDAMTIRKAKEMTCTIICTPHSNL